MRRAARPRLIADADSPESGGPAPCTPGGKTNFVVTLGSVAAAQRNNWTRLGTYTFGCAGAGASLVRSVRGETCYTGDSHARPMLQVIDDAGSFHGWVGVEMSRGNDLGGDYIALFRKADL